MKKIIILFCITTILLSGCLEDVKPDKVENTIDVNTTIECRISTYQNDWKCIEPCSCLFVKKILVCNSSFTNGGIVENV